jgi:hypothetical protein
MTAPLDADATVFQENPLDRGGIRGPGPRETEPLGTPADDAVLELRRVPPRERGTLPERPTRERQQRRLIRNRDGAHAESCGVADEPGSVIGDAVPIPLHEASLRLAKACYRRVLGSDGGSGAW